MADGPQGQPQPMADGPSALAWTGVSDKRSYYRLFSGYVLALLASGIATVALALLAFDLAGEESGAVIGTALSIKMFAYILGAPLVTMTADRVPRKVLLIGLDLVRAVSLLLLVFVTEVWQVYLLVFVFSLASATFALVYLAVVPYLLGSEEDYARSLARSRIATEFEGPISPILAAGLMLLLAAKGVFVIAAAGFLVSAALVQSARLPRQVARRSEGLWSKLSRGPKLFVRVPEFRAVIFLDAAVALASAMVMVNTVVIVQGLFDLQRDASAWAFFAFGIGAVAGAMLLPFLLARLPERPIMLGGGALLSLTLLAGAWQSTLPGLLALWTFLGFGTALALTPVIFLIRRLSAPADLQTLIVAQMTIANGCLLIAYSIAGWFGTMLGMPATFLILGAVTGAATWGAARQWPRAS